MDKTTIELYTDTRNRLKKIGNKGQTYDEIINQLIEKTQE